MSSRERKIDRSKLEPIRKRQEERGLIIRELKTIHQLSQRFQGYWSGNKRGFQAYGCLDAVWKGHRR